jgi:hypothetical protein
MKKALLILPIALTLGACSSMETMDTFERDSLPKDWVAECNVTDKEGWIPFFRDNTFIGCGIGTSADLTEAYELADINAKSKFASWKNSSISKDAAVEFKNGDRNSIIRMVELVDKVDVSKGLGFDKHIGKVENSRDYRVFLRMKWIVE